MVPRGSVLHCLPCVGEGTSRCNRALSYTRHSIHMHRPPLTDSMEVDARAHLKTGINIHSHLNCVTPACLNPRARKIAIEKQCSIKVFSVDINRCYRLADVQRILAGDASRSVVRKLVISLCGQRHVCRGVPKPAAAVLRSRARNPTFHGTVVAGEILLRAASQATRGSENGAISFEQLSIGWNQWGLANVIFGVEWGKGNDV
jgi:hypothetical protein